MTIAELSALTVSEKQFHAFKAQYPDYVLLFRIGEHYHAFHQDADLVRRTLGNAEPLAFDRIESTGAATYRNSKCVRRSGGRRKQRNNSGI